jgi:hypothetical protein
MSKLIFFELKIGFLYLSGDISLKRLFNTDGKDVETELAKNPTKMYFCHSITVNRNIKNSEFHAFRKGA